MALLDLQPSCAETLVVFDAYQMLQDINSDPAVYGLINVTDACLNFPAGMPPMVCANPAEYMFWDSVHPTTAVQAILADKFRSAFCATGEVNPGLRGRTTVKPPAAWRGVCFGTK
jgi:outer membrane lipase/esterase